MVNRVLNITVIHNIMSDLMFVNGIVLNSVIKKLTLNDVSNSLINNCSYKNKSSPKDVNEWLNVISYSIVENMDSSNNFNSGANITDVKFVLIDLLNNKITNDIKKLYEWSILDETIEEDKPL